VVLRMVRMVQSRMMFLLEYGKRIQVVSKIPSAEYQGSAELEFCHLAANYKRICY